MYQLIQRFINLFGQSYFETLILIFLLNAQNPMQESNPEQTCSLFSLVSYIYLDPVIMLGYRVPHLQADQLPPLSDSDYSQHLTKDAFPV
jgi:hypothetical protein